MRRIASHGLAPLGLLLGAAACAAPDPEMGDQALETPAESIATDAAALTSGDAYANQGANACSWTMGTLSIEKAVTFTSATGTFTLTSFKNKLPASATEYIQGGVTSDELRFSWDGAVLTGSSGGWTCKSGASSTVKVGGVNALQIDVALTRAKAQVTKHYVIHPSEGLIREWTEFKNTDTVAHTLASPSFLEQSLMASDVANLDLNYMTGAEHGVPNADSWKLKTTPLGSTYARTFDSYDQFDCNGPTCAQNAYSETSQNYIPWFSLWNRSRQDGVYMGFDYYGRWQAPVGLQNGKRVSLSLRLPTYSKSLVAGEIMVGPRAFVGVYKTDLDDMTNRLLDWQYRYLWDYTRAPYFTAIRLEGDWCAGSQWCGNWDQVGTLQKVFGFSDHLRTIGADTYHRDNGWWDVPGSWNGPDWKVSIDFLAKMGMKQLVYYFPYSASTDSAIYASSPGWFTNSSPCGYVDRIGDLSIPAAEAWVKNLLVNKAAAWGDYQWRNDACFIANVDGARQLAEDQAFRRIQQGFLDQRPGSAIQGVDTGGHDVNYEFLRMASSFSITDNDGFKEQYDASRVFPVDKLSGIPDLWPVADCSARYNALLMFNPDMAGDSAPTDASSLECVRKLVDTYHYLASQNVVGRWVRQYHPQGSDDNRNWFERLSQDGARGLIVYKGTGSASAVKVFPKGLNAATTYDVRYQIAAGSASRTGSDLMQNGISLSSIAQGELIFLGLPNHPGSGVDVTPPSAPSGLTVKAGTNMNYPGVEVSWSAATDNAWLSYYEVSRDGVSLGKVAKGTFFFDHSPAADPNASYGVRAVDGNGNGSAIVSSRGRGAASNFIDEAVGAGVSYVGNWGHDTSQYVDAFDTSTTWTNEVGASAQYTFTGSQITWYTKLGGNCGIGDVYIDGVLDASLDTFAPDDNNWDIPLYSKSWPSVGTHTIKVVVSGNKHPLSSDYYVHLDGFRVLATAPAVTEDSSSTVTYGGTGWQHSSGASPQASHADLSSSKQAGDSAQLTFTGNDIVWISRLGASMGEADVYIDGLYDARIDNYGYRGATVWQAPVYRKTWPTSGTHTIKVVVLGTKNLDASDSQVFIDSFHVRAGFETIVNDASLSYTAGWTNGGGDQTYLSSDAHYCNSAGCSVSYTFSGTAVQLLGDRDSNHGYANVWLDGVFQSQIDAYSPGASGGRQLLWQRSDLTNAAHTIKVDVVGGHGSLAYDSYVTIDALAYWTPG